MARRKVQEELTQEMIMDAARELFIEHGYQQVSMRQIAKKLGCSHGAIYYHFKNKAELFYALVVNHFDMLETKLDEILTKEIAPIEKLRTIMLGFIEFGLTYQSHYEIMFLKKDPEVRYYIKEKPNIVYQKFAESLHTYSEQQLSLKDIWSIFVSLHGFVTHYIGHVISFNDVKEMANHHVNFLLKGLM